MINKIIKNASLVGALLACFGSADNIKVKNSLEKSFSNEIEENNENVDLNREHVCGSVILTLTNTFSKKVASLESDVESLLKENDISYKQCSYLTNYLDLNDKEHKVDDSTELQFLVSLEDEDDENLRFVMKKLASTGNFTNVSPDYLMTQCSFSSSDLDSSCVGPLVSISALDAWNSYPASNYYTNIGLIDGPMEYSNYHVRTNSSFRKSFVSSYEQDEHALAMAGVIGADAVGSKKYYGVCKGCNVIPLTVISNYDYQKASSYKAATTSNVIKAINYATGLWETGNRIPVLNYSFSGYCKNDSLLTAIKSFPGLFVWSAGNDGECLDIDRAYYDCPNLISVGAIDQYNYVAPKSNYGPGINIFAPGYDEIVSTIHNNNLDKLTGIGTSVAASYVSGTAGLIYSNFPGISARMVKKAIIFSYDYISSTLLKLNVKKALDSAKSMYDSIKNDTTNPFEIEVLDDKTNSTKIKYLITNLSNNTLPIVYKGKTCSYSDVTTPKKSNGDVSLYLYGHSSKMMTITKDGSKTYFSVTHTSTIGKTTKIYATYCDVFGSNVTTNGKTSYKNYYEGSTSRDITKEQVFNDSDLSYLTFTPESSSGFLIKSWKVKIKNNSNKSLTITYNTKMCFLSDGVNWSGLKDTTTMTIGPNQEKGGISISGNGTAGSIAFGIQYINPEFGFTKMKVTAADGIKVGKTPNFNYNLVTF